MQISPTAEVAALTLTVLVHVLGAAVLIWNMLDGASFSLRDIWPRDEDDGGGGPSDEPLLPLDPTGPVMRAPLLPERYALTADPARSSVVRSGVTDDRGVAGSAGAPDGGRQFAPRDPS